MDVHAHWKKLEKNLTLPVNVSVRLRQKALQKAPSSEPQQKIKRLFRLRKEAPMELSKRLQAVADLVTEGASVADVGTDHGYIPIYLIEHI